jgi:hypothetical protein
MIAPNGRTSATAEASATSPRRAAQRQPSATPLRLDERPRRRRDACERGVFERNIAFRRREAHRLS